MKKILNIGLLESYKKVYKILNKKQKSQVFWLLLIMFFGAIFEMLSIGIIIPAIEFFKDSEEVEKYDFILTYFSIDEYTKIQLITIFFTVIYFLLYLIKNIYMVLMFWKQSKFTFSLMEYISKMLFSSYINQSYTFHLQRNSSELIRNVIGEVAVFNGVIKSTLLVATEVFVLVGIVILLLFVDPISTVIVGLIFVVSSWLFNRITSVYTIRWGKARQIHEGLRIQHVQQGLGGSKEIKLANCELEFIKRFNFHNAKSASVGQKQNFLENLPRVWIELLVIFILSFLVVVMTLQGRGFSEIAPTIIIFSMAAFRLMPSFSRIIGGIQRINYAIPIVDMIYSEFSNIKESSVNRSYTKSNLDWGHINIKDVVYKYPNTKKIILNKVTCKIVRNTSIGIIGESGSGKSTLVNIILGLLQPDSGDVTVDEVSIFKDVEKWQGKIGYVPQTIFLTDDTLRNNIAFGIREEDISDQKIDTAIELSQLRKFIETLPEKENTLVGENGARVSGGQKQRIGIARALYHNPEILIMDEATSSLDSETELEIMNDINSLHGKKTIIIITHRLSTISGCDSLYKMENKILNKIKG